MAVSIEEYIYRVNMAHMVKSGQLRAIIPNKGNYNNKNNKTFIYRPIRRPVLRRFTIGTMSKKSEIKQEQDK